MAAAGNDDFASGDYISYLIEMLGLGDHRWLAPLIAVATLLIVALVAYLVARMIVLRILAALMRKTTTTWDDALLDRGMFHRLLPLAPLVVLYQGVTLVPHLPETLLLVAGRVIAATMAVVIARGISAFLDAVNEVYTRYDISLSRPIKGYLQVVRVLLWILVAILVIATLMDRSPWIFLSGLGAMSAVLLLIFRDTLLSLVAGIQLTKNDLIRVGDWIEMPQFNADGDVVDISLHVVKVQNWDRTVTVIPTHKFLDHAFRNWRNVFEGGGRRIMRSINLDMNTIRFLRPDEIEGYFRWIALQDYMKSKVEELEEHNRSKVPGEVADVLANGRHLTNIGTFRAYVANYLKNHPRVHKELIMLIRQLQPSEHGLPIEIYLFTNVTGWVEYEAIQADIFDHILAVVPQFGLRVFQDPAGSDLAALRGG